MRVPQQPEKAKHLFAQVVPACRSLRFACPATLTLTPLFRVLTASDGGYTLLTLPPHTSASEAFSGIDWSTAHTGLQQCQALERLGISVTFGPTLSDVDTFDDVSLLYEELKASTELQTRATRTFEVVRRILETGSTESA